MPTRDASTRYISNRDDELAANDPRVFRYQNVRLHSESVDHHSLRINNFFSVRILLMRSAVQTATAVTERAVARPHAR
jgi:hypothetical protein